VPECPPVGPMPAAGQGFYFEKKNDMMLQDDLLMIIIPHTVK
jgi:hypothetical protein